MRLRNETFRIPNSSPKYFAPTELSFLIDPCGYKHLAPPELNPTPFEVLDYLPCGICSRPACHAATRMRSRATKIESLDWSSILRPSEDRTEGEKLIEGLFAVMNMATAQSVSLFQIERRDHLPSHNQLLQVWRVIAKCIDYGIGKLFTPRIPI